MRDRKEIIFTDGTFDVWSTTTYGIYISGSGRWIGAEPDVEAISIPGRNGDLTIFNNRWHNVTVEYDCFILKNFKANFEAFRAKLQSVPGYRKITDSYNLDEFRMARVEGYLNINDISWLEDAGSFTIRFNCMPQRYLNDGQFMSSISNGDELENETLFTAKPMIEIPPNSGGGTITLQHWNAGVLVAEEEVAVGDHDDYIILNSETQDAYDLGGNSVNNLITLTNNKFPELQVGTNKFVLSFTDPALQILVAPRWFTL